MLASSTQRDPPVGIPLFCRYQQPSNLPTAAFKLIFTRLIIQSLKSSHQSKRHSAMATPKASITNSGFKESYKLLKSKVKLLNVFLDWTEDSKFILLSHSNAPFVSFRRSLQKSFSRSC